MTMGGQHVRRTAVNHRRLADADVIQKLAARFGPFGIWDTNIYQDTQLNTGSPVTASDAPLLDQLSTSSSTTSTSTSISTTQTPPLIQLPLSTSSTSTSTPQSSTSSSSQPPVLSTTTTTSSSASSPPITSTTVLFTTPSLLASRASSVASGTSSPQLSSNSSTNVGGIVGGLAGGLAALILLIFVIKFIMRRKARKDGAGDIFSPSDFRRSAVLINDPPTHEDTVARGFNPRPPSMIERRYASPAPSFGTQYGAPGHQPYGNNTPGHAYATPGSYRRYSAFGPGQIMNHMSPPGMPMYQNTSYAQSPFSPIVSPVLGVGPNDQGYNGRDDIAPALTRQSSTGTQLTHQGSATAQDYQSYNAAPVPASHEVSYPAPAVIASRQSGSPHTSAEYVDLARTSMTPFQAAQYAEVSKSLNTEVPSGMGTPTENEESTNAPPVPPKDPPSPFADPIPVSLRPSRATRDSLIGQDVDRPVSTDSRLTMSVVHDLDFPEPPSPALTVASRFRVDSIPPTLPEIHLESRSSVHSSFGGESPRAGLSVKALRSPVAPSPLSAGFVADSSSADMPATPDADPVSIDAEPAVSEKELKRPETLYDPEDAYGGI